MTGPADERLRATIRELEATGGAIELLDSEWRLVWVSDELKAVLGEEDEEALGYGEHILSRYQAAPWRDLVDDASVEDVFSRNVPYVIEGTPGGLETIKEFAAEELAPVLEQIEPAPAPPVWAFPMEIVLGGTPAGRAWCYSTRLYDADGECFGIVRIYTVGLPARLLAIVARGDETLFERMAKVVEPDRRATAVLFADLDSSGVLARRLSGPAYFKLISAISEAMDGAVIEREGIVGKHAGDGATAFFLSEQLGSDSSAAKAAIRAALDLPRVVADAIAETHDGGIPVDAEDCKLNVGVHWGGSLLIGQLATRGRFEVTALGDEVNECARIEQSAHDGQLLASKAVVERLSRDDAGELGLDIEALVYRTVAELPAADEKAARDAGGIAVVDLRDVLDL